MELRHAAALALTGWYLMLPPVRSTSPLSPATKAAAARGFADCYDADAPISQWQTIEAFDTAEQCKAAFTKSTWSHRQHGLDCGLASAWLDAQCVATDDPRLKSITPPEPK